MKEKILVTIDREFGSGGHKVAKKLADKLGILLCDESLISRTADATGYNEEYIKTHDEKLSDYSVSSIFSGLEGYHTMPCESIHVEEFNIIREISSKESCVFVGRAADCVLKDLPHVSIFVFAPLEDRINRKLAIYKDMDKDMNYDSYQMEKLVLQMDKQRRKYYEFYTDNKWGARDAYDLLINTSRAGVDGAVDIIEAYINGGRGKNLMSDLDLKTNL